MKNKDRCLRACEELVEKYRNPVGNYFFLRVTCPLCEIFRKSIYGKDCGACPLASIDGSEGCSEFKSFKNAVAFARNTCNHECKFEAQQYEEDNPFDARAEFFERIKPILEAMPPEQFTKKGWRYTGNIISRKW